MKPSTLVQTPNADKMKSSNRSSTRSRTSQKSLDRRLNQAITNQKFNENMESVEKQQHTHHSMTSSASSGSTDTSTSWSSNVSPKTRTASRSAAQLTVVCPVESSAMDRMESINESNLEDSVARRGPSEQDLGEYYIKRYRKLSIHASKWSEVWTTEHYYRPPGCTDFIPINRSSSRRSSDT